jgi:hypothetical protein
VPPKQIEEEAEALERLRWSLENPGFSGDIEFDLTFELMGTKSIRRAKVHYEYTPEWEYFDLKKKALYVGIEGSVMSISLLTSPDDKPEKRQGSTDEKPEWVPLDDLARSGVLSLDAWEKLDSIAEERAKEEDAWRRQAFGVS